MIVNQESQEVIEEHFIVDGIIMNDSENNRIPTQILASNNSEVIIPEQVFIDDNNDGLMHLVKITTKNDDGNSNELVQFVENKNNIL